MRRNIWRCIVVLFAVALTSLVYSDISSYKSVSTAAITVAELKEHVRYLASDELEGRGSGTKGSQLAREYIAALFSDWGLRPMGGNGSYFQPFSFPGRLRLGEGNYLELTLPDGKQRVFLPDRDFLPLSLSASGEVEGEIVFAGYGISAPGKDYDDYANINVRGKIVLALRGMPANDTKFAQESTFPSKLRVAREKGAKALILVSGPLSPFEDEPVPFWNEPAMRDSGILGVTVKRAFAESLFYLEAVQRQIDETRKPFSFTIDNVYVRLRVNLQREQLEDANVIGLIEGSDPQLKNEFVVIGAHYDHVGTSTRGGQVQIFNGADDNASGTSGLLELAQYFSSNRERVKRSLLFIAFGAEERGLIGSRYFVENPTVPLERIVAMVNMDMIGRLRNETLFTIGVASSPAWKDLIAEVNSQFNFVLRDSPGMFGGSDHFTFYNKGIPVLFFFTGMHENYHRPSDDWDTLNYEGMEKLVRMIAIVVERIANMPERPQFQRAPQPEERPAAPMRVSTGVVPDYSWDGEGVKLMGVRPSSPAEKAGLKAGDIIVEIAGKQIRNLYDYMDALNSVEPNKPVNFVVLRDGQKITLTVIPEPVRRRSE
ncbi:MAG: M20/M25/M40 family metallo-hydrolase [Armatimonadetes bacterium]|nr:M20/M25/M40 family metallo-hydrolase [Armatimonadota bacterium]MCX7967981.1 M20/M25/M40 family metallo-hydrolase [Armatimonadota bacterium]MDW8142405.1 M20/M25/M40 family metallo-hydrolase [Armatimonadota bacterium]